MPHDLKSSPKPRSLDSIRTAQGHYREVLRSFLLPITHHVQHIRPPDTCLHPCLLQSKHGMSDCLHVSRESRLTRVPLKSSKAAKEQNRKDALVAQFRQVTGARFGFSPIAPLSFFCLPDLHNSQHDASKFLKKHAYRLDAALDDLYNDPAALAALSGQSSTETNGASSTKKLSELFNKYKGAWIDLDAVRLSHPHVSFPK